MVGYAGTFKRLVPHVSRIRQRVVFCLLAVLLAPMSWDSLPIVALRREHHTSATMVAVDGVRATLACHGRGSSTIVIVGEPAVAPVIDHAAQAELARFARLCILTLNATANSYTTPSLDVILSAALRSANEPAPYVIASDASMLATLDWKTGLIAQQLAGLVVITPAQPSASLVVSANGDQRPLPVGDRDELLLAILSLFWPPDEA